MEKTMLTIGFPTNKRLAESLAPLEKTLAFRRFPNIQWRPLRGQDSANMLYEKNSSLDMAISGRDLMIIERIRQERELSRLPPDPAIIADTKAVLSAVAEVLEVDNADPVNMCLLIRKEDEEKLLEARDRKNGDGTKNPSRFGDRMYSAIATSYPDVAEVALIELLTEYVRPLEQDDPNSIIRLPLIIRKVNGKVESILRFRDYRDVDFALDIVKSGKTAAAMEVKRFGTPLLESKTGLYRGWNARNKSPQLLEDFIKSFKECLLRAGLNWKKGMGENFADALKPWKPGSSVSI